MSPDTLLARLPRSRFLRFLLVGGISAAVNVCSRILLGTFLPYGWSVLVAYLCGMSTAWMLSRIFVFAPSGTGRAREYARFGLVNLTAAAQVWLISVGLRDHVFPALGFTFHPETVAHVIGVAAPVFTSYLGHQRFSFAVQRPQR